MRTRRLALLLCALALFLLALPTAWSKPEEKKSSVTLIGGIDELGYLCSSAGLKLSAGKGSRKVEKVSLGSAAAYSGVRPGDLITGIATQDNTITVTINRSGRTYEAVIATDVKGLKAEFEKRKIPFSFGQTPFDKDLKILADSNLIILLDRSASMGDRHADVPGELSKWTWCKQQIDNLYLSTAMFDTKFEVMPFNNSYQRLKNITLWDLKNLFNRIKPEGETKSISTALQAALDEHFKERTEKSKPCVILVLSDGKENQGTPLQTVLIDASKKVVRKGEVMVIFMQVGNSLLGEELFNDLDRNLIAKGGAYDIATFKSFAELKNRGLLWELIAVIKAN